MDTGFAHWIDSYLEKSGMSMTTRFVMTQIDPVKLMTLGQLVQILKAMDAGTQDMVRSTLDEGGDPMGLFNSIVKSIEI